MKKYPAQKINRWYGYRTKRSMKTKDNWDFAQSYSSIKMIWTGVLMLALSPLGQYYKSEDLTSIIIALTFVILGALIPIVLTEKALKERE